MKNMEMILEKGAKSKITKIVQTAKKLRKSGLFTVDKNNTIMSVIADSKKETPGFFMMRLNEDNPKAKNYQDIIDAFPKNILFDGVLLKKCIDEIDGKSVSILNTELAAVKDMNAINEFYNKIESYMHKVSVMKLKKRTDLDYDNIKKAVDANEIMIIGSDTISSPCMFAKYEAKNFSLKNDLEIYMNVEDVHPNMFMIRIVDDLFTIDSYYLVV